MSDTDEQRIRDLWRTMAEGWLRGDAALFASVFAEDADFVTVRGEELSGRADVEQGHARLFATVFRGTRLTVDISLVRPLAEGMSLVHVRTTVVPDGPLTHAQAVVTRYGGAWRIRAFHNLVPHVPYVPRTPHDAPPPPVSRGEGP